MTLYELLKFLHILAAIVWVGGNVTLQLLTVLVLRSGDGPRRAALGRESEWIGTRVFTPVSGILLLLGILLVLEGDWSWGEPFVSGGLLIWLVSLVIGLAFLGPESGRIGNLVKAEGPESPAVRARIDRVLLVSRLDLILLVIAVFLMVAKPGT